MISVKQLRVDYDDVCAVRDVSLDIGPGEVCGLIGPNGAGKTTTMRAMLGLLEPTYGTVMIAGIDVREQPRKACQMIGFMPDFPPMYEDLKCWEFLDLFASSYFVPRRKRAEVVSEHLELVGLTEKRNAMVLELSRGMRQRLMLAKTLIPDPRVLLLDEPASGMDPHGRIALKSILKQRREAGKTILVSSHILAEMTEFCTSMAIMERGKLVVSGTIDQVRRQVSEGMVLLIEILGPDEEGLKRIVAEDPHSGPLVQSGSHYSVHYRGTPEEAADLLARLVHGGVRVSSFSCRKEGLEELFLKIGARELS